MSDNSKNQMIRHTVDLTNLPPLTEEQSERLSRLANLPDEQIDFSDLPKLSDAQLEKFKPARDRKTKEMTSVRLDSDVLTWLRRSGKGWQTRLNAILREAMTLSQESA